MVPRWVLLINVRNGTGGYKALNRSVISYMGFAECLDTDNEQETCGPASVAALPYGSRTPPRDAPCCCPSPQVILCLAQGCLGMYSIAGFLLPAPG